MLATITVKIKRLPNGENLPLPQYMTEGAAGIDLRAALETEMVLNPGKRLLIPTGFQIEIPKGYEGQIRPRSGLALQYGVTLLNSPGTIDSDYRGEIKVLLINHGDKPFIIECGDRIAQLVIQSVIRVNLELETGTLESTKRGAGGFGHTGSS